jgi:AcrR family transcriptional regulator
MKAELIPLPSTRSYFGDKFLKKLHSQPRKKLDLRPVYVDVTKLLLHKNPEQISFSLVAKKTKVPRSTLYYYFNSDIKSLILESVRFSMREFMQLWENPPLPEVEQFRSWEQMQSFKFKKAIQFVSTAPWTLELYFRYCRHPSYVGAEICHIEKIYLQSIKRDRHSFQVDELEERHQHLLSHLKLGVLWGIIGKNNIWEGNEEELATTCSKLFFEFL